MKGGAAGSAHAQVEQQCAVQAAAAAIRGAAIAGTTQSGGGQQANKSAWCSRACAYGVSAQGGVAADLQLRRAAAVAAAAVAAAARTWGDDRVSSRSRALMTAANNAVGVGWRPSEAITS